MTWCFELIADEVLGGAAQDVAARAGGWHARASRQVTDRTRKEGCKDSGSKRHEWHHRKNV